MKITFMTLLLALITLEGYSQNSPNSFKIKDYSLRDYVAPDIRYKRFELGTRFNGSGNQHGDNNTINYGGNVQLGLDTYKNLTNYQGSGYTSFIVNYSGSASKATSNKSALFSPQISFGHTSVNRMYNSNDRFIGIHPEIQTYYNSFWREQTSGSNVSTIKQRNQSYNGSLVLSVGTGRIQPVKAARQAMDILISLEKYNRLSKNPSKAQIDSLAKIANSIAYKRFYDYRFKRIYQLEELDKGIEQLDLVENRDMVYAANLSDIWNYGRTYSRGSGTRYEVGFIPFADYTNNFSDDEIIKNENSQTTYGLSGFAGWIKQTPVNYAWQSDFSVILSYDISTKQNEQVSPTPSESENKTSSQILGTRWTLGYYPNTRTEVRFGPFINLSAAKISSIQNGNSFDSEYFGMATGAGFESYYYISPRFRLGIEAASSFISDEYTDVHPGRRLIATNSSLNQSIPTNLSGENYFRYSYQFTLTYAIL
jgi:hypothetical protein